MGASNYTKRDVEVAQKLTSIEGKIDLLNEKLIPLFQLQTTVQEHDRQISRWQGVNATLASTLAIGLTITGSLYAKFRHWF